MTMNVHFREVDKKPRSDGRLPTVVQNRLAWMGKTACRKPRGTTLRRVTHASAVHQIE